MPYIYPNPKSLEGQPKIDGCQCVALVRHYAKAPSTSLWREGEAVLGTKISFQAPRLRHLLKADGRLWIMVTTQRCMSARLPTHSPSSTSTAIMVAAQLPFAASKYCQKKLTERMIARQTTPLHFPL